MTRINDQVIGQIAADLDNADTIQSGVLNPTLQPVLNAEEFRKKYVQIQETAVTAATDVSVVIRIRTKFRWRVLRAAWKNTMVNDKALVVISSDRTVPVVPGFFQRLGEAEIKKASEEVIIGDMSPDFQSTQQEQRPGPFIIPAAGELRFDITSMAAGGLFELGTQVLELFGERLPDERSWDRIRANTVVVV